MNIQQSLSSRSFSGLLVCAFLLTTGCYSISKEFPISQGEVSQYLNCLKNKGGNCPKGEGFHATSQATTEWLRALRGNLLQSITNKLKKEENRSAMNVWDHPVQKKIIAFYDYLNTGTDPQNLATVVPVLSTMGTSESKTYSLEFDAEELRDYQTRIHESVQSNGWDALEKAANDVGSSLNKALSMIPNNLDAEIQLEQKNRLTKDLQEADRVRRIATYVRAYLEAYFRNGEFFQVSANTDLDKLKEQLNKVIKGRFPQLNSAAIGELSAKAAGELQGKLYFGDIGTTGFVTRSGDPYQFPTLEARFDPLAKRSLTVSKLDFAVVGADLVRVVLEGTFDAISDLPAVSTATGAIHKDIPEPDRLRIHDPSTSEVSADEFGKVSAFGSQTEAATSTAFGQFVRGAGWMSLNNEYLGKLMETLVGVTVRKIMEQCAWCYYACGLNDPNQAKANKAPNEKTTLKIKITASRGIF